HAGHVRAFSRLLRCVLPESAEGTDVDQERLSLVVRTLRRDHHTDCAIHGFRTRRKGGRSARDVSQRYLYGDREPGGCAGHQCALRTFSGETANGISVAGTVLVGAGVVQVGPRLRAGATVYRASAGFCARGVIARCLRLALSGIRSPVKISSTFLAVPTNGVTSSPTWITPGNKPFRLIS